MWKMETAVSAYWVKGSNICLLSMTQKRTRVKGGPHHPNGRALTSFLALPAHQRQRPGQFSATHQCERAAGPGSKNSQHSQSTVIETQGLECACVCMHMGVCACVCTCVCVPMCVLYVKCLQSPFHCLKKLFFFKKNNTE